MRTAPLLECISFVFVAYTRWQRGLTNRRERKKRKYVNRDAIVDEGILRTKMNGCHFIFKLLIVLWTKLKHSYTFLVKSTCNEQEIEWTRKIANRKKVFQVFWFKFTVKMDRDTDQQACKRCQVLQFYRKIPSDNCYRFLGNVISLCYSLHFLFIALIHSFFFLSNIRW